VIAGRAILQFRQLHMQCQGCHLHSHVIHWTRKYQIIDSIRDFKMQGFQYKLSTSSFPLSAFDINEVNCNWLECIVRQGGV
jgi:hypothetical protein